MSGVMPGRRDHGGCDAGQAVPPHPLAHTDIEAITTQRGWVPAGGTTPRRGGVTAGLPAVSSGQGPRATVGMVGAGRVRSGENGDGRAPKSCIPGPPCRAMPQHLALLGQAPCSRAMGLRGKEGAKRRCRCFAEEGVRKELLISQPAGTGSLLPRLQLTLSARRCRAGKGVLGVAALMRERERKKGQK